jgi:hypothetical protein
MTRRADAGFILQETLIALFLSLTMMGIFVAALSTARRARSLQESIEPIDRVSAIGGAIGAWMECVMPLAIDPTKQGAELFFMGGESSLKFATLGAGDALPGGANAIELFVAQGRDSKELRLRTWELDHNAVVVATRGRYDALVEGVRYARFSYFGSKKGDDRPTWHADWNAPRTLPLVVSLSLSLAGARGAQTFDWKFLVNAREIKAARDAGTETPGR